MLGSFQRQPPSMPSVPAHAYSSSYWRGWVYSLAPWFLIWQYDLLLSMVYHHMGFALRFDKALVHFDFNSCALGIATTAWPDLVCWKLRRVEPNQVTPLILLMTNLFPVTANHYLILWFSPAKTTRQFQLTFILLTQIYAFVLSLWYLERFVVHYFGNYFDM